MNLLSIRLLLTLLVTVLAAGAALVALWKVQAAIGYESPGAVLAQAGAALACGLVPALVARREERALCVAVALAPTLLVLGLAALAVPAGRLPGAAAWLFLVYAAAMAAVLAALRAAARRRGSDGR